MMASEDKRQKYIEALQTNKILKDLDANELSFLSEHLEKEVWPKNTCSINKPRIKSRFHFVVSGRLKIYKMDEDSGREFTLFLLKKNDAFDVLCLLDGGEHKVFYETLDKVVLLSTPMEKMEQWVKSHPDINKNMMPVLGQQMRIMEEYASNLTLIDISTRLARLILSNINSQSQKLELINDFSNEELASLIGSTRAVVNRHLQHFKNEGILHLGRQKVEVANLQLLLEKAHSHHLSSS